MKFLIDFLDRQSKAFIVLLGVLIVLLVAIADYRAGPGIFSFLIYYLVPIFLVSWFVNRRWGFLMCSLSAFAWLISDLKAEASDVFSPIPYWNMAVKFGFFFLTASVVSELKKSMLAEKMLARTDDLTGLTNHRFFLELAEMELKRNRRYGRPFTLVYLDVDDFKKVNDRLGHNAGDNLLKKTAEALKGSLRNTDVVARLGGDEFAVLMPETSDDASRTVLGRMREMLLADVRKKDGSSVTFSIGALTFKKPPDSLEEAIKNADRLMYDVKSGGKNGLKFAVY